MTENPHRLPHTARPVRYGLVLSPDLEAATFSGVVDIDITVLEAADFLLLNAAELDISAVTVGGAPASFTLEPATERLRIHAAIEPGDTSVHIEFTGVLNDQLRGFYRSTFRDDDGVEHVIATTQMQTTDCRRAFPCWDEPEFKAVFDVALVVAPHLVAISNGAERSRVERADGTHEVRFNETMPMSTYLVAFVVGPLEVTDPVIVPRLGGGEIPVRIVHVPGKSSLTAFGLEIGAFAVEFFQRYYDIAYPTDKCDMIALPDFAAGAMENLGCITYRENMLLVDPTSSTQADQAVVADVVAHEMAHMWFGDLVTMRWWNGIWLNEAFATFMEVECVDAFRPAWQRWTAFNLERTVAFDTDALASTRTVEFPVEAPDECDGMFDVLTYQKGASLLRMLEQYLGTDGFRAGINRYLRTHLHGNTETGDLWDAIEAANPETPVRQVMDSWIWQAGHPLISARLRDGRLVLRQERMTLGGDDLGPDLATTFLVPLHLRNGDEPWTVLLDGAELIVDLPHPDAAVVVNAGGHGFVRVAYDDELRARLLGDTLATLSTTERYMLVDDAWNAVVSGRLPAVDFLTFVGGFAHERELAVWQGIGIGLRGVGRLLDGEARVAYQARVRALVRPVFESLGWDRQPDEDDLTSSLRGVLVGMLGALANDVEVQERCRAILEHPDGVDPELVATATSVVASVGTDDDFDRFLAAFRTAPTPQEQLRALYALAEFPTAAQMQRTCELAMSGEVRTQNAPFLLSRAIANREHGATAWEFVRRHWDDANRAFPTTTIIRMVDGVRVLTEPAAVADVQSFFAEHPIPQSARTLEQVLERQRVNAALRTREAGPLAEALGRS
ncbi:MAG: M1 family metallopeptidase [Ilumatobacteraceae bacterium]